MQKAVNTAAGEFMQKSMFMFDPSAAMSGQPNGATSAIKIPAAAQSYFAGYLPQEALAGMATMPPLPLIAPYISSAQVPHHHHHMPMSYVQEEPAQLRKLFIGGLNHETTDDQLKDYYSQWGTVVDCIVIRDPATKHSRGFGFVTYATIKMAENAMDARPHTINGKVVDPKRAIPREHMLPLTPNNPPHFLETEPAAGCKLTLSGIHWDYHTVDGFRQYFEKFGDVEQVEIVGHPRGYGFIVFEKRESAELCLQAGKNHTVNGKRVEVKESTTNDQSPQASASSATTNTKRPGNTGPNRNLTSNQQQQPRSSPDQHQNRRVGAQKDFGKKPSTTSTEPNTRQFVASSINDFPHLNSTTANTK